eukprot:scaffold4991_cov38-Attheya_sp.AAC.1
MAMGAPIAPMGAANVGNAVTPHVAENENKNKNAGTGVVEHENYDAVTAIEASDFPPQMKSDMAEDLEMSNIVDYAIDEESDDNGEHEENSSNCDDEAAFITSDL